MVTIVTTELIPYKFQNPQLLQFQKIYIACGLLLFFQEIQINEEVVVEKIKIFKEVTPCERIFGKIFKYGLVDGDLHSKNFDR